MKRRKIRRNMSEKRLMKLKRSLRKRAKKLRLGKKRIGAYVFGTLRRIKANRRRSLRRNEEYARQIPRESRPMKGRGFSSKFDTSAGSTHADLARFVSSGRDKYSRKIADNTVVRYYNDHSIGVILYDTRILHYHPDMSVDVNFGGYMTPTTFSRINSLIPYGWRVRKKGGKLALENSWGQRAVVRQPRAGEEYSIKLTEDKAYLID